MNKLHEIRKKFEATKSNTKELTKLMDEMEKEFNIPALNNEQFNKANPEVMDLYKEIAAKRNI